MITASLCKYCKQRIVWIHTKAGDPVPVNLATWKPGDLLYHPEKHVIHGTTCPARPKHDSKKRPERRAAA